MKEEVLNIVRTERSLLTKELEESIRELEEMKTRIKNNPGREGINLSIKELPLVMNRLVSRKSAYELLIRLESQIMGLAE